jgi:hypothetical protein
VYFIEHSPRLGAYSGEDAVRYAVTYALHPNKSYRYLAYHGDGGGDCSNFISQCLKAGGAPMVYSGPRPWWYNNRGTPDIRDDTWSVSWSVANSLYWCLKTRGRLKLPGLKGIEVNDMDSLERGDLIQYEDVNSIIYHSVIITNFGYDRGVRIPLVSQHSFEGLNIPYMKPKASRMHFMKISI